ncbi:hypothetical protein PF001_g22100 [Phytophthora fragariae]|uniref:Uncharacterized protein n=1 Tax=Phytophthora fragariae TaxID=53985 RepID=A0A6A4C587_9STRA|nr:hypothetical protein PF003_g3443 [Phytophthora fragariae]KAE9285022.1 hypothetical protein PF001_g22100 [Phytophthora fragariae]
MSSPSSEFSEAFVKGGDWKLAAIRNDLPYTTAHCAGVYSGTDPKQRGDHYAIVTDNHIALSGGNISEYQLNTKTNYVSGNLARPEFGKATIEYVHEIPDYSDRVWNINASAIKGCTMFFKRYASSPCSAYYRMRDDNNKLFLIFNSDLEVAFWKCARNRPSFTIDLC